MSVNLKSFTRFLPPIARILMGALFVLTGLNGFLDFIPHPPTMPEFAMALTNTRYMIPLIAGTQLLVGVLLISGFFVPLALVLIAPIIVNIVAFHLFLDHSGLRIAGIVLAIEIYLVWAYRKAYGPMLAMRAKPAV